METWKDMESAYIKAMESVRVVWIEKWIKGLLEKDEEQ